MVKNIVLIGVVGFSMMVGLGANAGPKAKQPMSEEGFVKITRYFKLQSASGTAKKPVTIKLTDEHLTYINAMSGGSLRHLTPAQRAFALKHR